jgi:hypothetical protein
MSNSPSSEGSLWALLPLPPRWTCPIFLLVLIRILYPQQLFVCVFNRYPIQFYAAIEVIEVHCGLSPLLAAGAVDRRVIKSAGKRACARASLRIAVVGFTCVLAYAVPKLSLVIALFGALFGGMIELVLPPLLYLAWCPSADQGGGRKPRGVVLVNWIALIAGIAAVIGGTAQALVSIIHSM